MISNGECVRVSMFLKLWMTLEGDRLKSFAASKIMDDPIRRLSELGILFIEMNNQEDVI